MRGLGTCILLLISNWGILFSQEHMNTILKIPSTLDFEINGKGNHENWEQSSWTDLTALRGAEGAYETKVKVMYSEKGIYFLFWCQDQNITATMEEDFADLWNEDVVEVFLWTDESHPLYFEYELSPLNYELPILIPKIGDTFLGWRPWHYRGDRLVQHATDIQKEQDIVKGWRAEFFIPFDLLRPLNQVPPRPGTRWRANMYRIDYDAEKPVWWAWQPIEKNFHDNHLFGTFEFE